MKKIVVVVLVLVLLASQALAGARRITAAEAKALMDKNRNIFLLDVRTPQEFSQAYIKGAKLIPSGELERRVKEIPKDRPVLVYCAVGSRSRPVADYLAQQGYKDVYEMSDGIVGWYRNGFPIAK